MAKARVVNHLGSFIEGVRTKAAVGMTQALVLGASEASVLTPIDTSTLLNSQFKRVVSDGTRVTGTAGYTASYAVPVHDPEVKQNFRRATAQKEFLLKGFQNAEPSIRAVLARALKTR